MNTEMSGPTHVLLLKHEQRSYVRSERRVFNRYPGVCKLKLQDRQQFVRHKARETMSRQWAHGIDGQHWTIEHEFGSPNCAAAAAPRSDQTRVPHRGLQTGLMASRKGLSLVKDTEVRVRVMMLSTRSIKLLAALLETTPDWLQMWGAVGP